MRLRFNETDLTFDTELGDQVLDMPHLACAVQSARTTDDQQESIRPIQRGEGAHSDIGAFQRLDATDEQQNGTTDR